MKIILDFDDTILDTGNWVEKLVNVFTKEGFSREEYNINYEKSKEKKGDFDPDFMIELFGEIKEIDKDRLKQEISEAINESRNFIYKDFFDFAKSFNKQDLILVSVGLKDIQTAKITNTGICGYFDKISIPIKYKSDEISLIAKKYPSEKIIFIDDKAAQIDEAKNRLPQITAIKMERPSGRHINPKSKLADYTVKNFKDAENIINKLKN